MKPVEWNAEDKNVWILIKELNTTGLAIAQFENTKEIGQQDGN